MLQTEQYPSRGRTRNSVLEADSRMRSSSTGIAPESWQLHMKARVALSLLCVISIYFTPVAAVNIGAATSGNAATDNTVLILASTTANAVGSPIKPCGAACVAITGNAIYGNTWEACASSPSEIWPHGGNRLVVHQLFSLIHWTVIDSKIFKSRFEVYTVKSSCSGVGYFIKVHSCHSVDFVIIQSIWNCLLVEGL